MARRIKYERGKQPTLPIKSKKQLDHIMDYLRYNIDHAKTKIKKDQAYRNYMLILIGINTAFRAEDLLQLKVKNVIKGFFSIKENKTGKWQHFKMNKELHKEILDYIEYFDLKEEDYLFMGQKKYNTYKGVTTKVIYPITRQNVQNTIMPKIIKDCGITYKFGLHSLRKTFGYHFYKSGGELLTLMKMYKHENPTITLLYIMWDDDDVHSSRTDTYLGGRRK